MTQNFDGKTAVVTGATKGIGKSIADLLLERGANVIGTGRNVDHDKSTPGVLWVSTDFLAPPDSERSLQKFLSMLVDFQPDIVVNNAGINVLSGTSDLQMSDFHDVVSVNLVAPLTICKTVTPIMKRKGWGRILNISSIWSKIGKARRISYMASKFALDGVTLSLAAELSSDGVLCNCLAPGFVRTEMTERNLSKSEIAQLTNEIPIGRLASPIEVAEFAAWLVSPQNTYVAGQNLTIDGGFSRV